jgi:Heterokaryon incompatibility protein (HET)
MRLLNTTSYTLEDVAIETCPKYAILSHTWEDEEILYVDIQQPFQTWNRKRGAKKIIGFCELSRQEGCNWVWIDTCNIDKSSSSELSEAINSMFLYYQRAYVCYVYLSDVYEREPVDELTLYASLERSKWFTRGWTLQELLAPPSVEFYNHDWLEIGSKFDLVDHISSITGIDSDALLHRRPLQEFPVAVRMSWASMRDTTRLEDMAYCLLGIFQINMPLLYGEGQRAFQRLQEEILKSTQDYSVLAWQPNNEEGSILAPSPWGFYSTGSKIELTPRKYAEQAGGDSTMEDPSTVLARGVRLALPVLERTENKITVFLHCSYSTGPTRMYVLVDLQFVPECGNYRRCPSGLTFTEDYQQLSSIKPTVIYCDAQVAPWPETSRQFPQSLMLLAPNGAYLSLMIDDDSFTAFCGIYVCYSEHSNDDQTLLLYLGSNPQGGWWCSVDLWEFWDMNHVELLDALEPNYIVSKYESQLNSTLDLADNATIQFSIERQAHRWTRNQNSRFDLPRDKFENARRAHEHYLAQMTTSGGLSQLRLCALCKYHLKGRSVTRDFLVAPAPIKPIRL